MRSLTANILSCACIALAATGALAQTENAGEPQVVHLEPLHGPEATKLTRYGNCQWLYPLDEPNAIELEPRITDRHGGTFTTLTKNNNRHQPPAHLVIKDADGKQVAEVALEYG